ncbi:hypothetical protein [Blastococcus sp. SYSU DS0617]
MPVGIEELVQVVRWDAGPGDLGAGAVPGRSFPVQDGDLPLLDVQALGAEGLHEPDGVDVLGGRAHGVGVGPGRRDDAAAALAVGEHRQADAAVGLLDGRHYLVTREGDAGVEVVGVGLDGGGSSVHAAAPSARGGAPVASPLGAHLGGDRRRPQCRDGRSWARRSS